MSTFPKSMLELVRELSKLPSIGEKSAMRLAYHLVSSDPSRALSLAESIKRAAGSVKLCKQCFFLSEDELCSICKSSSRDKGVICVVEKPMDLVAIERGGEFRGLYHVLHGLWAPLRGQGEEHMKLKELLQRVKETATTEVILGTSTTVEGDATALYIGKLLGELGVRATRLAQGLPRGGEIEYADDLTVAKALAGRSQLRI